MSEPVEVLMFGPHDVEAGHNLTLDVTQRALEGVRDLGQGADIPGYYAVMGLVRAVAKLSVVALEGYEDGVAIMLAAAMAQEIANRDQPGSALQ